MRRGNDNLANINQKQTEQDRKENGHFKLGDTIIVRVCSIDEAHYNFWRTIEQEEFSGGNPFGSPIPIESNIKNGLGVWGGYGASYYTVIAK